MLQKLSEKDMQVLRDKNLLYHGEIAFKEGETIIAENLTTRSRRVIVVQGILLEANRRLLHD